jgi:ElaB/YqjD/DUF883 family membrane-anchored ribosome-binding protein
MTDIVEQLLKQVVIVFKTTDETEYEEVPDQTCQKAADEIKRLREENEKLSNESRIVTERRSWEAFQKAMHEIEQLREWNKEIALNAKAYAEQSKQLGGALEALCYHWDDLLNNIHDCGEEYEAREKARNALEEWRKSND